MNLRTTLLFAALVITLAGCGNDAAPSTAGTSAGEPLPEPVPDTLAGPPPAPKLVSASPVSTEGATGLNDDCNLEGVDGDLFKSASLTVPQGGTREIGGWLVDKAGKMIPTNLQLVVAGVGATAGVFISDAATWVDRAGVAETRGYGPELAKSGFLFKVDMADVPAGTYHVYVMGDGAAGKVVCDPGRQLVVEG